MGERRSKLLRWRRARAGLLVVAMAAAACGGTDPTDSSEPEPTDAPSVEEDVGSVDAQADDQVDNQDSGADVDAGGGSADVSGVDWASVDLTTIDWANIDMDDVDLVAIEDNPTVANISADDLAIIQGRLAASFGSGVATLTIADRTWQFEGFVCAFESSGVLNEGTTLGTNILDEADGVRIQMQIDVYSDGTAQFTMDDIEDFENPAFSYLETTDIAVAVDGDTVRASGEVTDQASENFDVVAMSFEGECGPGSLR
ncbi:MAG: hypothetical protein HKN93_08575 [Acidimicrobiia bacterium]|nr:hypothetical protein [Acidimicrobiia bacterium]